MEKVKRTIVKLFAVIAVAVALLLCGALLGCGEKNGDDGIKEVPDSPLMNGFYIKAEMQEGEQCAINDITIDLIYGVDIDHFNNIAHGYNVYHHLEDCGIYVCAYNCDGYPYENFDEEKLYADLSTLEEGAVKDGALLIEEIPYCYTNGYMLGDKLMFEDERFLSLNNLKGTEYEATVNNEPHQITCYKRQTVYLPRELFIADDGCLFIDVIVCGSYRRDDNAYFRPIGDLCQYPIRFDYNVADDKIIFSKITAGEESVVYGTKNSLSPRMKSRSNEKPIDAQDESEHEQIQSQSEPTCSGVEGTISWIDDSGNSHPAQFIKIAAFVKLTPNIPLGSCYTDVNGEYNISFTISHFSSDKIYI